MSRKPIALSCDVQFIELSRTSGFEFSVLEITWKWYCAKKSFPIGADLTYMGFSCSVASS